jgi:hypothetical protein
VNVLLPSRYDEVIHRLALGVEPTDALTGMRIATDVEVTIDPADLIRPRRGRPIERHMSGRFALRYAGESAPPVVVRLADPSRRYVPRRIRFPFATESDMLTDERAGTPVPAERRIRRPVLFPGAAYPLLGAATAVRGRVTHAGVAARWARISAKVTSSGVAIGSTHGDDRGEFLLVLGTDTGNLAELVSPLTITVTAVGPDPIPAAPAADAADQLTDLPVEDAPAPADPDDVSPGTKLPEHYLPGRTVARDVDLQLGRVTAVTAPFDLP